jgi:hypothetical protein
VAAFAKYAGRAQTMTDHARMLAAATAFPLVFMRPASTQSVTGLRSRRF